MNRGSALLSASLCLVTVVGTACLAPPVAPLDTAHAAEGVAEDEQHLWKQAREAEQRLDHSGMRFDDPTLDMYLTSVAASVAGDPLAAAGIEPRVRVLSNPDMNAFAFPHGTIYVHSALLARMENEAQLATMLSREYAHVLNRHSLQKHRADRRAGNALAMTGLVSTGVQGGSYAQLLLQAGHYSSMGGYHHSLEQRADSDGLAMLDAAGYDLSQAPRLFELTVEYLEEVAAQRARPGAGFSFSTPIHMKSRISAYHQLLQAEYTTGSTGPGRRVGESVFNEKVHALRVHQAGLELDRGRFDSALRTAELALESSPGDTGAWVVVGEAKLRSKSHPDRAGAIEAWQEAIRIDRGHAGAHRALGLLYYRDFRQRGERRADAESHLARYLRAEPDAADAGHVRHYLADLRAEEEAS